MLRYCWAGLTEPRTFQLLILPCQSEVRGTRSCKETEPAQMTQNGQRDIRTLWYRVITVKLWEVGQGGCQCSGTAWALATGGEQFFCASVILLLLFSFFLSLSEPMSCCIFFFSILNKQFCGAQLPAGLSHNTNSALLRCKDASLQHLPHQSLCPFTYPRDTLKKSSNTILDLPMIITFADKANASLLLLICCFPKNSQVWEISQFSTYTPYDDSVDPLETICIHPGIHEYSPGSSVLCSHVKHCHIVFNADAVKLARWLQPVMLTSLELRNCEQALFIFLWHKQVRWGWVYHKRLLPTG